MGRCSAQRRGEARRSNSESGCASARGRRVYCLQAARQNKQRRMRFLRMAEKSKHWFLRPSTRWIAFRSVPFNRLWVLLAAVFLLFSVIGFYVDLVQTKGAIPYLVVLAIAAFSGLNA